MKKLAVIAGAAVAVAVIALVVMADQEQPAGAPPMEMGAPPQMKQVAFMEGTWDAETRHRMDPDAPWIKGKAVTTFTLVLDGCALRSDFEGETEGMLFKGFGLTCFNRITGKWQSMWADNTGMGMSMYEGDFEGDKMTFSGKDILPGGVEVLTRVTNFNITPTAYEWLMENSTDGGKTWFSSMEGSYKKR